MTGYPQDGPDNKTLNPTGWLRGIESILSGVTTTSLPPDPDEDYDPADDEPWSTITTFGIFPDVPPGLRRHG